jgi:PPK2 family polyphosphate:nucleotide phosphotransferase
VSKLVIDAPKQVHLADYDPEDTDGMTKDEAQARLPDLTRRLEQLQGWLYGAKRQSVLVILQGMDTAGKDGAIKRVFTGFTPSGCQVCSFKVPTEEERNHDFLWRVHRYTPERGMIAVFNRSHYEDVLVARVHSLVPREVLEQRYRQINDFERLLTENNTLLFKFFLHISKQEQALRLLEREQDPEAGWKLSVSDWQERERWHEYQEAYEAALERCSTPQAPWYMPANKKWYRNEVIARTLVEQLEPLSRQWKEALKEQSERARKELAAFHAQEEAAGQDQRERGNSHKKKRKG